MKNSGGHFNDRRTVFEVLGGCNRPFKITTTKYNRMEKEQELQEIAERLMQSEFLAASVEILREFAEKCWQEGACEAQNNAAKEIEKNYIARVR